MVFVGAAIWVAAGAVVFSAHSTQSVAVVPDTQGVAAQMASAAAGYDGVPSQDPWYARLFGDVGLLFGRMVPGQTVQTPAPAADTESIAVRELPPSCVVTISPNSVQYGGSATVFWDSRNADRVVFQGLGEVSKSGSQIISDITSSRAYALAVEGAGGSSSCYTVVDVAALASEPPTCVISAHEDTISAGESTSLSWGSENSVTANLSGEGQVAAVGGLTVSPKTSTTYTLTVGSPAGQTATCTTSIQVK
jgi:hypothetical protein